MPAFAADHDIPTDATADQLVAEMTCVNDLRRELLRDFDGTDPEVRARLAALSDRFGSLGRRLEQLRSQAHTATASV